LGGCAGAGKEELRIEKKEKEINIYIYFFFNHLGASLDECGPGGPLGWPGCHP
jgi:hypothetical protein